MSNFVLGCKNKFRTKKILLNVAWEFPVMVNKLLMGTPTSTATANLGSATESNN